MISSRALVGIIVFGGILACSGERQPAVAAKINGPLVTLMTQHASATCGRSDRTYATTFHHPPYQTCTATTDDSTESAEIDSDSVVVELTNTWKAAPVDQVAVFADEERNLTSRFGSPKYCSATKAEWKQGDSLDVVLEIAPVSQVGTEFGEGPYRMTRVARLGAIDPSIGGC